MPAGPTPAQDGLPAVEPTGLSGHHGRPGPVHSRLPISGAKRFARTTTFRDDRKRRERPIRTRCCLSGLCFATCRAGAGNSPPSTMIATARPTGRAPKPSSPRHSDRTFRSLIMSDAIQPFPIHIPQADLDELADRLARTRWPDADTVQDGSQGPQSDRNRTASARSRSGGRTVTTGVPRRSCSTAGAAAAR